MILSQVYIKDLASRDADVRSAVVVRLAPRGRGSTRTAIRRVPQAQHSRGLVEGCFHTARRLQPRNPRFRRGKPTRPRGRLLEVIRESVCIAGENLTPAYAPQADACSAFCRALIARTRSLFFARRRSASSGVSCALRARHRTRSRSRRASFSSSL